MNGGDLDGLLRVARRVTDGEALTPQLMGQEGVPVPLRLVIAVAVLSAANQPVTKSAILTTAPAARSATYRDHAELLEELTALLPALVRAELDLVGVTVTAAELSDQLQAANRSIREERARRELAEADLEHVVSYARELHWQLKPEHEELLRERKEKVLPLRPLPNQSTDDDR